MVTGNSALDAKSSSPLLNAYFDRKVEMRRFFLARLQSASEADDLVQDLYLKVSSLTIVEEIQSPGAYLYRLAANLMLDRLRGQHRAAARDGQWRHANHLISPREDVADVPSAEAVVAARQRLERVVQALEALPIKTQRVFRLHKFEGLGHAEVASRLGISRSAVEKHMIDALRHLVAMVGR